MGEKTKLSSILMDPLPFATSLYKQDRFDDAFYFVTLKLAEYPRNFALLNLAAKCAVELKKYDQADLFWRKCTEVNPKDLPTLLNLANLYHERGRLETAQIFYQKALACDPHSSDTHNRYGAFLYKCHRYTAAESHYRYALQAAPHESEAYNNLGVLLKSQKRLEEAFACFKRAIELKPDRLVGYINLGQLYEDQDDLEKAELCYKTALRYAPNHWDIHNGLGAFYGRIRRFKEAEDYFRRALELNPEHPDILNNLSFVLLAQGRFSEGWKYREARYHPTLKNPNSVIPPLSCPQWKGEDLRGKSLVIWHEQGYGDVIQFARYAGILKNQGALTITFVCAAPLTSLLQSLKGVDKVLSLEEQALLKPHDYWTFPLSISYYLQTTLDTIPSCGQYLSVSPECEKKWMPYLPQGIFKVGLVWKGAATHKGDAARSLPSLESLKALWAIPGLSFISLQKGQGEAEAQHPPSDQPLIHLGSDIQDFSDSAAIINQLDLLVCVDTAIAHLAGALNRPVWVLAPYAADWRWMMDREDSPWYPSLRLFRQKQRGLWAPVIESVATELKQLLRR